MSSRGGHSRTFQQDEEEQMSPKTITFADGGAIPENEQA